MGLLLSFQVVIMELLDCSKLDSRINAGDWVMSQDKYSKKDVIW